MSTLVLVLAALGGLLTLALAVAFARDPAAGMRQATHRLEMLPLVMIDRYAAFSFLTLGAVILGDMRVIAWLFASYAFMSVADGWIYARQGHPHIKHTAAGLASILVVVLALAAVNANGAA